ncbi:MAG: cytochrome c oxidase subunit II [Pseudomonadota bacterium]
MVTTTAGGCSGPLSTLDPAGPAASHVAAFWWAMLAGATALTLLVLALLALAFRRRARTGQSSPGLWIGWLGVAMPIMVLTVLVGAGLILGERVMVPGLSGAVVIEATGRQWSWEFSHRGSHGTAVTQDVLHMPAGRPVELHVAAVDVIHSFWVPRLAGKLDAIPGQVNVLRLQVTQPGVFEGQCAEFCGRGHSGHLFRVVAHDEAGWAAFQRGELR